MEWMKSFREKSQTKRQEAIRIQAEDTICLTDFANELYIAYNGTPLVPINKEWTSKEILEELNKRRQNYINSRMQESCSRIAAVL